MKKEECASSQSVFLPPRTHKQASACPHSPFRSSVGATTLWERFPISNVVLLVRIRSLGLFPRPCKDGGTHSAQKGLCQRAACLPPELARSRARFNRHLNCFESVYFASYCICINYSPFILLFSATASVQ